MSSTYLLMSFLAMLTMAVAHGTKVDLYFATAIMSIGFGLVFSSMSSLIVHAVPPEQTGVASGMNANIRTIGGSIGAALMASIVTANLGKGGLPKESGYTIGFAMLAAVLVVSAGAASLIPKVTTNKISSNLKGEPDHAELAVIAGGTLIGDKTE